MAVIIENCPDLWVYPTNTAAAPTICTFDAIADPALPPEPTLPLPPVVLPPLPPIEPPAPPVVMPPIDLMPPTDPIVFVPVSCIADDGLPKFSPQPPFCTNGVGEPNTGVLMLLGSLLIAAVFLWRGRGE